MNDFHKQEWFLRGVMGANAVFSGLSGLGLAAGHPYLAAWMGLAWPLALLAIGLGLILFAAHIVYLLYRPVLERREAAWIIGGDLAWVAASGVLLLAFPHFFNGVGKTAVLGVAGVVLLFAELQAYGLWKLYKNGPAVQA